MDELTGIVRMLDGVRQPTAAELRRAAETLHGYACPRPHAVVIAQWRVAVLLEKLERRGSLATSAA